MSPERRILLLSLLIVSISGAIAVFGEAVHLPAEVSAKLNEYWHKYKALFNKTYTGNVENARRIAWEQNLVKIYGHNLMAAAGHYSYTLRDNHIADLSTRQYIREMVGKRWSMPLMVANIESRISFLPEFTNPFKSHRFPLCPECLNTDDTPEIYIL